MHEDGVERAAGAISAIQGQGSFLATTLLMIPMHVELLIVLRDDFEAESFIKRPSRIVPDDPQGDRLCFSACQA